MLHKKRFRLIICNSRNNRTAKKSSLELPVAVIKDLNSHVNLIGSLSNKVAFDICYHCRSSCAE